MEIKLGAGHSFDDKHDAGACWTTQQVGCFGAIWGRNSAEQLAAACEGGFPSSISEEAEVADADQAFGQHVKKKSAQELIC